MIYPNSYLTISGLSKILLVKLKTYIIKENGFVLVRIIHRSSNTLLSFPLSNTNQQKVLPMLLNETIQYIIPKQYLYDKGKDDFILQKTFKNK